MVEVDAPSAAMMVGSAAIVDTRALGRAASNRTVVVAAAVAPLHDIEVAGPVQAERELLRLVEGSCDLPFGAWCRRLDGGDFELVSVIESNGELVRASCRGKSPEELAERLWAQLSRQLSRAPTNGAEVGA